MTAHDSGPRGGEYTSPLPPAGAGLITRRWDAALELIRAGDALRELAKVCRSADQEKYGRPGLVRHVRARQVVAWQGRRGSVGRGQACLGTAWPGE
jgi:hypothetical protein